MDAPPAEIPALRFQTSAEDAGRTLAAALRERLPGVSWSRVRRLFETGKVTVGGEIEHDDARRLRAGEQIVLEPTARRRERPPDVAVAIVHEDGEVVVIDKPEGVSSVPYEKKEQGTAMDLLREAWRRSGRPHVTSIPLHVVHRIDKETSGLLVFAKSKRAERHLQAQLRAHTMEREYRCVAQGDVWKQTIRTRLVEDRGDGLRGSAKRPNQGKDAVTHVEPLERLSDATLCVVRLETGKTHQIRIHFAEIGHPLIGERVYIRDLCNRGGTPIESPRLLLHAATLGFEHPDGETLRFESQLPPSFTRMLDKLHR